MEPAMHARLSQLANKVKLPAVRLFDRRIRDIGGQVHSLMTNPSWKGVPAKKAAALEEAIADASHIRKLLDSLDFIESHVLDRGSGALVVDLRVSDDLRKAQEQIEDLWATKVAPRRGFVYIAWCRRPEIYYYVGKAVSSARLRLSAHGKLARATGPGHATTLSLIFPSSKSEAVLFGLEASVDFLIESATGSRPEFNDARGRIPAGTGTKKLSAAADLMSGVENALRK